MGELSLKLDGARAKSPDHVRAGGGRVFCGLRYAHHLSRVVGKERQENKVFTVFRIAGLELDVKL